METQSLWGGAEEGYLRKLAAHYGIAERVNFVGFVKDRAEIWKKNHIQIFPTRGEGGPMVLTEGMMAGRSVVITDCGNASLYVTHGVDGFLVDFPTVAGFSKSMEEAWERRADWKEMGRAAHRTISCNLTVLPPAEELYNILQRHE